MKQPLKVLVIDSDPEDRKRLADILDATDWDVSIHEATDATSGIAAFRTDDFDCVFLDDALPDLTGPQAIEALCAAKPGLPNVVAMTHSMHSERVKVLARAGAADCVKKNEVSLALVERSIRYAAARAQFVKALGHEKGRTAESLKIFDELKSRFVSAVPHGIHTPIDEARSNLVPISAKALVALNPEQSEYVELVERNLDRLSGLLGDLLDYSQLEAGTLPLEPGRHDVAALVREAATVTRERTPGTRRTVRADLPTTALHARCDARRTIQVLAHLLDNAFRHNPDGTTVVVKAERRGDRIVVRVADDGIGIDAADHERLFDCFFQVDRTPGDGSKGTGLGLAIARRLMLLQGGLIAVRSQKGEGSEFLLELPSAHARAATEPDTEPYDFGDLLLLTAQDHAKDG